LKDLNIRSSTGRVGQCWDNALAESFFGALKNELVHRTVFPTKKHARRAIAEYIEVFYNRIRLHSALATRHRLKSPKHTVKTSPKPRNN
jgi:putative transposase